MKRAKEKVSLIITPANVSKAQSETMEVVPMIQLHHGE